MAIHACKDTGESEQESAGIPGGERNAGPGTTRPSALVADSGRALRVIVWVTFMVCAALSRVNPAEAHGKTLTFTADARIRYEFQDNFNQKYYACDPGGATLDDGFALGRFRLGFDYRPLHEVHLALYGQHAEVWDMALADEAYYNKKLGMEHNPNKDHWELSDAYLEIVEPFKAPISLKGGRQRIAYGNNRVFGPGTWGNSGRWIWDAVKVSWKFKGGFFDSYYGRTMVHEPVRFSLSHRHFYESYGVYCHYQLPENLLGVVLEPFFMTKVDAHDDYAGEDGQSGDLDTYYAGGRSCLKGLGGFDFDATYVKQRGDYGTDEVEASGYHLRLAYNIPNVGIKPTIALAYSYGSGDSDPNDGMHETFDAAFGSRGKCYGRMNLFQWQNIKDAEVAIEVRPMKWCYLKAEGHRFWLAEARDAWYLNAKEYSDQTGESGDDVGKELDITAVISLPIGNLIEAGFGHFWPDQFAETEAWPDAANWVFVQWTVVLSRSTP